MQPSDRYLRGDGQTIAAREPLGSPSRPLAASADPCPCPGPRFWRISPAPNLAMGCVKLVGCKSGPRSGRHGAHLQNHPITGGAPTVRPCVEADRRGLLRRAGLHTLDPRSLSDRSQDGRSKSVDLTECQADLP